MFVNALLFIRHRCFLLCLNYRLEELNFLYQQGVSSLNYPVGLGIGLSRPTGCFKSELPCWSRNWTF